MMQFEVVLSYDTTRSLSPIAVYATTAANGHESSYACYWDEKRQTFLGDLYSVKWMENSDVANLQKETLESQYSK
mgnify:CR=1